MRVLNKFRFAIDRGGTFTDIYAETPKGVRVMKLLSEDPDHYEDAPREGIRRILAEALDCQIAKDAIPTDQLEWIRMGTTVATNALLERQGAPTVLVITRGFRDLLQIGNQSRPRIFDLRIEKPELLYEQVIEVDARVRLLAEDESVPEGVREVRGRGGERLAVLQALDQEAVREALEAAFEDGARACAVLCAHAYTFVDHEAQIGALAREVGFEQVSLSHLVMPAVKMVSRGDTTVVDAYLSPHIRRYIDNFKRGFVQQLDEVPLWFMRSDGGLTPADGFDGSKAILSGPAGGVVGCAQTAWQTCKQPILGFDMGGTSTDVSRYAGEYELVHEAETAGVRIQAPQLHIATVAAGGGSKLSLRNGMFASGPESVGAHPGPVCYGKGGELAITDANLVLGRLLPDHFPKIFGPNADAPLDKAASIAAFERLTEEVNEERQRQNLEAMSLEEVALGFLEVANDTMVRPMRELSVMRGYDIAEHVLACFGGAGGQHACAVARMLGIGRIFIHQFAGILSAYGMGLADVVEERRQAFRGVLQELSCAKLDVKLASLAHDAQAVLRERGFEKDAVTVQDFLNLRYQGTDTALMVPRPEDGDWAGAFTAMYKRDFGFTLDRPLLVDDLRVRATARLAHPQGLSLEEKAAATEALEQTRMYFSGGWTDAPVFRFDDLDADESVTGPALLIHDTSTIVVEPDCVARRNAQGDLLIDVAQVAARDAQDTQADPVRLAIFGNLFMSIAEQMGRTLQRTSVSTNIKERLDFSCAIFDADGGLVANAPHLPVHLGAMGAAVRYQLQLLGDDLAPGDVLVSNHPDAGGSHLPDITVMTPVFRHGKLRFFVANRGHHADIGGITPGSMPPFSRSLMEEGACIRSFKLVRHGVFQEDGILELLRAPGLIKRGEGQAKIAGSRAEADNLSDLRAQVAANQRGIELLDQMMDHYGEEVVLAFMRHIQANAERAVRALLRRKVGEWGKREVCARDFLDNGSEIRLRVRIDADAGSAVFDFSGTSPEMFGNCNAPRAVTLSAIIYSLRCLIDEEMPLNQGCLAPIEVIIPEGCLLSPSADAAVVGGNVLTSQRVTDVVLAAFGAASGSQGCMNNFTFGNDAFGYYETIAGGAGAGPGWHGQSGVQTHMTNTRITDPEILERRYPVLLECFSLRTGSGGTGAFCGGDGVVRELRFLQAMEASILSERRVFAPYALDGGERGARGRNLLLRGDGRVVDLGGKASLRVDAGDRIRIETPGGSGFGVGADDEA